ncbi:NAD-dependent epimerase/dehydratase family protein [Pelagicoccus sp. SDUM812005]|uniref:NAD-dependent epimerase/dehydratase family protein n=1 Tax=Pelagicoccus sp. SDUM812005 TaxID=3041257 RepID=UPI00280CF814|nr:NAD-dependent epimerase/dehydratase family protein [Pelagicoccus sp. SDUM812005]MDQ8179772.1 NAD-dependent epimerase/dehydratase family protein [Pelagicoccus sp. SDUM812005]
MVETKGKCLLVLGCGYLGRILVGEAIARGMRVKAVSRNLDTLAEVEEMGAEVFAGLVDEDGWHGFAGGDVDFVVNCVSSAGGGLAGYRQSYVEGNRSLCKWAEEVGFAGRAIYTSSVSVYGDAGGAWVDEGTAPPPANERGALMRESEDVFLQGMKGVAATVLRLAGLYGPGRHLMLDRLKLGEAELPGWGDYYLNLVRIEDAVSAVWSCLEAEVAVSGVFTVVDDEPALKQDIAAWIAGTLGNPVPRYTGEADGSGRGSRRLGETGRPANRRISNSAFCEAAGWRPRFASFREGFGDLLGEG